MNKHLIVVSVDAMVYEDLALLKTMPNVGKLIREGSIVERVKTILSKPYPSGARVADVRLSRGQNGRSEQHAVSAGREKHAVVQSSFADAVRNDLSCGASRRTFEPACRWPMTAGGFDQIDYLVPEIMDEDVAEEPNLEKLYRKMCTPCLCRPYLFQASFNPERAGAPSFL